MRSKRLFTVAFLIIAIVLAQVVVHPVFATDEIVIGEGHDLTPLYYDGHLVAEGFAVDISQFLPIDPGEWLKGKVAFAVALCGGWEEEGGIIPDYYTPYVKSMRVKVDGDSYYNPVPVNIVDNTGTGEGCTLGWELLLDVLLGVLMEGLAYLVLEEPPSTSWETNAHWIQANVYGHEPHIGVGRLQTAGASYQSEWDAQDYHTLTVTAEAEIWVERKYWYTGPGGPLPLYQQIYVGIYSESFTSDPVLVGEEEEPPPVTHGCPTLFVWNGTDYYEEGLLDIHNPEGIDVITSHTLVTTPERVDGAYLMRLTEHPKGRSHTDEVKLYATIENGTTVELPLIWARHTEYGNVLPQMLFSDDWKTETLGAELNNGTSQSIDLKFAGLSPHLKIVGFTFQIEGNNKGKR